HKSILAHAHHGTDAFALEVRDEGRRGQPSPRERPNDLCGRGQRVGAVAGAQHLHVPLAAPQGPRHSRRLAHGAEGRACTALVALGPRWICSLQCDHANHPFGSDFGGAGELPAPLRPAFFPPPCRNSPPPLAPPPPPPAPRSGPPHLTGAILPPRGLSTSAPSSDACAARSASRTRRAKGDSVSR